MPLQLFKSVYFSDVPTDSERRQGLTLAFGAGDAALHETVSHASSVQVRQWIGHETYASLQRAAQQESRPLNTYCLLRLRKALQGQKGRSNAARTVDDTELGLLATFRGGTHEPLHGWFPYLEGYSPRFVEHVLASFAPEAARVLDPFGGVGTTPLTVSRLGREAFYCELNPLLQQLVATKTHALLASDPERELIAQWLEAASVNLRAALLSAEPDGGLAQSYRAIFGESLFFDDATFDLILRARRLADDWHCAAADCASFGKLALLSALVPASLLIRRGDLRFKTAVELARGQADFVETASRQMQRMADDLRHLEPIASGPLLLCGDARALDKVPPVECDAVVTSPPYLNGTNYFRNTKVELWFLRCLRHGGDLAAFRTQAVTAGINDVTVGKLQNGIPPEAVDVVAALARDAYDQRIPAMAANYFADMATVIDGLAPHLRRNAVLALDIGDSAYGGVHVPTDAVLKVMLKARGFRETADITLRKRASRDGRHLRQALLVFDYRPRVAQLRMREDAAATQPWERKWRKFKTDLPHQHGVFAKRNWGHPLHSLCSYQGKMKPSLAHFLVKTFTSPGGVLLDPFAGVGTIPFEAALSGVRTWSFDISPAALPIARAKVGRVEPTACAEIIGRLAEFLETESVVESDRAAASQIKFNGPLPEYFSPKTYAEVLKARRFFLDHPPADTSQSLVFACLLHILHGNRPYALSRRSHPITPFAPQGPSEYRPLLPRLREKVERSLNAEVFPEFVPGEVLDQDACAWWPPEVCDLDAVITSPPFFDSTRFYLANWMRLWFCGWEAQDFKVRPLGFVDERQKKSFTVYEPIFRQARERLKPGGVFVLHLGRSRKCDMGELLRTFARRWFRVADLFTEDVGHCESHGIRDKGTVTAHQFLVLE